MLGTNTEYSLPKPSTTWNLKGNQTPTVQMLSLTSRLPGHSFEAVASNHLLCYSPPDTAKMVSILAPGKTARTLKDTFWYMLHSWKYPYLLDSEHSKGSAVKPHICSTNTYKYVDLLILIFCQPPIYWYKEILCNSRDCFDSLTKLLLDDSLILPNSCRGDVTSAAFVLGSPRQASRSTSVGHGIRLYHRKRNIGMGKIYGIYIYIM